MMCEHEAIQSYGFKLSLPYLMREECEMEEVTYDRYASVGRDNIDKRRGEKKEMGGGGEESLISPDIYIPFMVWVSFHPIDRCV